MAALAEQTHDLAFDWQSAEAQFLNGPNKATQEYAHSLRTIADLGYTAVSAAEREACTELAYQDYKTAVTEMLKTDAEFRDKLDIDRVHEHPIIDGKVCDDTGRPMVTILQDGYRASRQAAMGDPAMQGQAERDYHDVLLAQRVDRLAPGQTVWGISMDPKDDMRNYRATYKKLGYKEGLIYIQAYSKIDDHRLLTYSFSVDYSDAAVWRELAAGYGMRIPEEASLNTWLAYATKQAHDVDTSTLLHGIRQAYYARIGRSSERYSVTDYVQQHERTLRSFFDAYYPALGEAVVSGINKQVLREFAGTLLKNSDSRHLKADIRDQLSHIADSDDFQNEYAKTIDSLIRYATVEQLRKYLTAYVAPRQTHNTYVQYQPTVIPETVFMPQQLHILLADNVGQGVKAGRSYGGCPGNIELGGKDSQGTYDGSLQEAYGGKGSVFDAESAGGGKKKMTCPYCKAKVVDDPCARVLKCWDCSAKVVDGKVVSEGDGGSRARREREREAYQKQEQERLIARIAMQNKVNSTEQPPSMHKTQPPAVAKQDMALAA